MTQATNTFTFHSSKAEFSQIKDTFKSLVKEQTITKQLFKQSQRDHNYSLESVLRSSINSNALLFYIYLKMKYAKELFASKVGINFSENQLIQLKKDTEYFIEIYLKYSKDEVFTTKHIHRFTPQILTMLKLLDNLQLLSDLQGK